MNEHIQNEQKNETMGENSFMKKLLKKRLNQKGLTLIELLAVIVILAIVAAIAVPAIGGIIANSRDKAILADASAVLAGAKLADVGGACNIEATAADAADACDQGTMDEYVDTNLTSYSVITSGGNLVISTNTLKPTADWNLNPAPTVTGNAGAVSITEANLTTALQR